MSIPKGQVSLRHREPVSRSRNKRRIAAVGSICFPRYPNKVTACGAKKSINVIVRVLRSNLNTKATGARRAPILCEGAAGEGFITLCSKVSYRLVNKMHFPGVSFIEFESTKLNSRNLDLGWFAAPSYTSSYLSLIVNFRDATPQP